MRLFLAREALDPHLKVAAAALNSQLPMGQRLKAALKAGVFYAGWYPRQWLPSASGAGKLSPGLRKHVRYVSRNSRRLARKLFHAMVRFGPKLEKQQVLLGRFVDIGTELFAMAATCSRAEHVMKTAGPDEKKDICHLADYFCANARLRIERHFDGLRHNADAKGYKLAQKLLQTDPKFLRDGIVA
jgi:hypothetical protein